MLCYDSMKRFFYIFPVIICIFTIAFLLDRIKTVRSSTMEYPYYRDEVFELPKDIKARITLVPQGSKAYVPIFMYHYVEYVQDRGDTIRQKLDIVPNIFEEQIKTLIGSSYHFIFIKDIVADIQNGSDLPENPIAFTFDDGYRDFYTSVYPILKKYKVKATIYVITGFLGRPNYMTKDMVKEVAASGLVEVASHTVHHPTLKNMEEISVVKELADSKKDLENLIGQPVTDFAYPYGSFNNATLDLVKKTGYKSSASVIPGAYQSENNLYFLYRLRPGGSTGAYLLDFLEREKKKNDKNP